MRSKKGPKSYGLRLSVEVKHPSGLASLETTGPFQTTRRWVHPPFTLRTTVCQRNRGPFRKQEAKLLITLRTVEQRESISQRFISLRGKFEGPIPESWCCMLKQTSHDGAISSVPRPRCVRAQRPSQEMSKCVNNRQRRRSSLCSYPAKIQFERLSATVWQLWVGTHLHFWHIEKEIRREREVSGFGTGPAFPTLHLFSTSARIQAPVPDPKPYSPQTLQVTPASQVFNSVCWNNAAT